MFKSVVVDTAHSWTHQRRPAIAWEDTIIYEAHVKGLTQQRNDIPEAARGNFRGLSEPSMIAHLRRLGVTAVELLPIHAFLDDRHLLDRNLRNYWGYNTLSFFAPEARYAAANPLNEFRATVAALHDAGIEVILDVVYNHTCEGNQMGPTLCYRGIDNASYYWLLPDQPRYYDDFTGTGNSLNLAHPRVLQMVMDSLRYWVETFHVDGFRFDLASTLGREPAFNRSAPFFAAVQQDPVLQRRQIDRRAVGRRPWRLSGRRLPHRLVGMERRLPPHGAALLARRRQPDRRSGACDDRLGRAIPARRPRPALRASTTSPCMTASRSPISSATSTSTTRPTARTTATARTTTSQHQLRRRRPDRRRSDPGAAPAICGATSWQRLLLAQGVPLILAGDEVGNSQDGNNNAYCQDDETGWIDWTQGGQRGRSHRADRHAHRDCGGASRNCSRAAGSRARRRTAPTT